MEGNDHRHHSLDPNKKPLSRIYRHEYTVGHPQYLVKYLSCGTSPEELPDHNDVKPSRKSFCQILMTPVHLTIRSRLMTYQLHWHPNLLLLWSSACTSDPLQVWILMHPVALKWQPPISMRDTLDFLSEQMWYWTLSYVVSYHRSLIVDLS